MKKRVSIIVFLGLLFTLFAQEQMSEEEKIKEDRINKSRVKINFTFDEDFNKKKKEIGHVFFDGFDFKHYEPETYGIEGMLEATLPLLEEAYSESKQPFVFVGHSQGGLRALAMSTYLKEKNPELYKQLRGVITISGIDRGLELLEGRGSLFRMRLSEDIRILTDGTIGVVQAFNFIPTDFLEDLIFGQGHKKLAEAAMEHLTFLLLGNWLGTSRFAYPIVWNKEWDEYAQIRDMVPQSEVIKKYVLEETKNAYSYVDYNDYTSEIEWRKKWGWLPYPVVVKKYKTKYFYKTAVDMKVDKDLPFKFLKGSVSDTTDLYENLDLGLTLGLHTTGLIYTAAGAVHVGKCALLFGFLTNSVVYADDCFKAASWCINYKDEISEALGGPVHDGLVTVNYQQLPIYSEIDRTNTKKVLNNAEVKEYPHLNHFNMNYLYEGDPLVPVPNPAKAYANLTVQEWLKD